MKNLKEIIIILMITIVLIGLIIFILLKNIEQDNYVGSDFQNTVFEKNDSYQVETEIIKVKNRNKYYAIEKVLNTYIRYIKEMKGIIDFQEYEDDEIKNEGVLKLYSILDKEYISELNVQKEHLQEKIKKYENYDFSINELYVYEKSSSINIYFVYGTIDDEKLNLLIKTDSSNMTFSIFLEDYIESKSYSIDMNINNINITDKEIQENDYNKYKYTNITDEYMVKQYINSLKNNILNNIEYTYNNLLDEDYKNKRFGNIENFFEYILESKEILNKIEIQKYLVNYYDDYTEYVCMDQYENYYIFKENAIMDYTFMLDTYTIATEKFKTEYENAEDEKKVQMNIDKFIQMINRHDYKTSYKYISEGFKSNYFRTQNEFENCIKNNFFLYNKLEFKNIEKKGSNLYVCNVQISDLTEANSEVKEISIIMQLNDNMDFEMSFGIQ